MMIDNRPPSMPSYDNDADDEDDENEDEDKGEGEGEGIGEGGVTNLSQDVKENMEYL